MIHILLHLVQLLHCHAHVLPRPPQVVHGFPVHMPSVWTPGHASFNPPPLPGHAVPPFRH